jgi:uncharacterized protein YbjQ (UPF0145 family)
MRFVFSSVLLCLLLAVPMTAAARNTEVIQSVQGAVESDIKAHLLKDVQYFMKGQKHPGVAKEMATVSTNQSTRGAFRSDEASCNVAFLSAVRRLQDRAKLDGGDAVVDIVSVTRGTLTESASDFRCVAGSAIVHVGLKGTIVKLK